MVKQVVAMPTSPRRGARKSPGAKAVRTGERALPPQMDSAVPAAHAREKAGQSAANLPETADSGEIQGKAPVQERESGGAPREQEKIVWEKVDDISPLFKSGEVAQDFEEPVGALYRKDGEFEYIAISAAPDEPFPLMPVFCFGEQQSIDGKEYIVFKIKNGDCFF